VFHVDLTGGSLLVMSHETQLRVSIAEGSSARRRTRRKAGQAETASTSRQARLNATPPGACTGGVEVETAAPRSVIAAPSFTPSAP